MGTIQTKMTDQTRDDLWPIILDDVSPSGTLSRALHNAAYKLGKLLGQSMKFDGLSIETFRFDRLNGDLAGLAEDIVGVHLFSGGELPGRAILFLSPGHALTLADRLLAAEPGTTTELGVVVYSALAETGNIVFSAFLNVLAQHTTYPLKPSLPVVMFDRLEAFLKATTSVPDEAPDELLIIKSDFVDNSNSVLVRFWVLPDLNTLARNGTNTRGLRGQSPSNDL